MSSGTPVKPALQTLRGARLFRGVDTAILSALADIAHHSSLEEGCALWQAGAPASYFTVIQRGVVQIERRTPGGDPAIVGVFGPRESVGDAAALTGAPYPASAIAASERVDVLQIPREAVVHGMEREPNLAKAVQTALLDHTHALTAKIDIVSAGSVAARLATLLLHLGARFGDEDDAGTLTIPVSLSRVAFSRLVSARVETVIRALSVWTKSGLLQTTERGFTIRSVEELRAVARAG